MAQNLDHTATSIQDPIRIRVDIDPGTPFSSTPEPQRQPQLAVYHNPAPAPQSQSHPNLPPTSEADPAEPPEADDQDADSSSTTSSSSSTASTKKPESDPTNPIHPIYDAPFRPRMEYPHPIPNHKGYFHGPVGGAMYAGGSTPHFGAGGQELTPGMEMANAQMMMQGMGAMPGNVAMGGMYAHVWQQGYCRWG